MSNDEEPSFADEAPSGVRLATTDGADDRLLYPSPWIETWLGSERIRFALAEMAGGESTALNLVKRLRDDPETTLVGYQLAEMQRHGLVSTRAYNQGRTTLYRLTADGVSSLWEAGPSKEPTASWARWAGLAAFFVASHHGVSAHAMMRDTSGDAVLARSRLCAILIRAGWSAASVRMHFGMPEDLILRGAARWHRLASRKVAAATLMRRAAEKRAKDKRQAA